VNQHFDKRRERLNLFQAIFSKPKTIKISEKELDFVVCPKCNKAIESNEIKKHLSVCPQCDYHFPLSAYQRVETVFDPSSFYEVYANATSTGLNNFPDYLNKLTRYQKDTNLNEAVVVGTAKVNDIKVAVAIMDSRFMMGSMGQIVGEKITRIIELATRRKYPLIIFFFIKGYFMLEILFGESIKNSLIFSLKGHFKKQLFVFFFFFFDFFFFKYFFFFKKGTKLVQKWWGNPRRE